MYIWKNDKERGKERVSSPPPSVSRKSFHVGSLTSTSLANISLISTCIKYFSNSIRKCNGTDNRQYSDDVLGLSYLGE